MNFNPYSRQHLGDPYPVYEALREERPVHHNERPPFWAISRYDDVHACLKDWRRFVSGAGITLDGFTGFKPMIILMDPPRHDQLRRVLLHAFTPNRIAGLEPEIRRIARHLLAEVPAHDTVDLVQTFTAPLPMLVVASLLGVDPEDQATFKEWSNGIMLSNPDGTDLLENYDHIFDYFERVVAARRREPGDDLVSALVEAEVDGVRLPDDEILGFCALLLIAGNETTTNLLGNAAIVLDRFRDVRQELLDDPSLVPAAVEETLRYESSVPTLTRTTSCDIELHDQIIPAGEKVLLLLAAANRDPRRFDRPEVFDLHRPDRGEHLSFGAGIHFCMGANLARLEIRVAIEELLGHLPAYELVEERLEYFNTPSIRGPVRLSASPGARRVDRP